MNEPADDKLKRVLYAEDEFTNRKLLQIKLKTLGVQCDLAQDGMEAYEMYEQHDYSLIILDQYMPGMNGDEVAKKIRKKNVSIPLIAITSDDREVDTLKSAGFNEIFIKPLRGNSYINIINSYLQKSR
ncbi:MAG: response regulator [Spirochaetales bacterium]|nr:response regulator [Spirochaetales bacterium]